MLQSLIQRLGWSSVPRLSDDLKEVPCTALNQTYILPSSAVVLLGEGMSWVVYFICYIWPNMFFLTALCMSDNLNVHHSIAAICIPGEAKCIVIIIIIIIRIRIAL